MPDKSLYKFIVKLFFIIVLILNFGYIAAYSDPITIEIEKTNYTTLGQLISIPIVLASGSAEIESFDFTIRYDSRAMTFYGITKSELYDIPGSYEWEHLTYRGEISTFDDNNTRFRTARIMGEADKSDDGHLPLDLLVPDGTVLAYLNFHTTYHGSYDCHFLPIEFYWTNCNDNIINLADLSTAISNTVYDYQGVNVTNLSGTLPGPGGTPNYCLDSIMATRTIDFLGGGVDVMCFGKMYSRGDLNVNGQPYEISDAVVYDNYFKYGMAAFLFCLECQIAESDINCDGLVLSVADYVMLIRIIRLLANPCN